MRHIIFLSLCINFALAQQSVTVYEIPFASKGNVIDLSVSNGSAFTADEVNVTITGIPEGIKFTDKTVTIKSLKSKEEGVASFTFSVDKLAKVNKEQILSFTITDKTGQKWSKDIKINITPPMNYELYQNYPNPFNPATTIEYQLPGSGTQFGVSLKIYDMIGREIDCLVNERQEPGFYQETFNASQYSSGMYFYQLIVTDAQNNKHIFKKKMLLLK